MVPSVGGRFVAVLQEYVEPLAGNVQMLRIEDPKSADQERNADCREHHPGSYKSILFRIFRSAVGGPGSGDPPVIEMVVSENNRDDRTKEERKIGDRNLLRKIIRNTCHAKQVIERK